MKAIKEFIQSISSFPRALIIGLGMWKYLLLLLVSIAIFVIPVFLIGSATQFLSSLIPYVNGEKYANIGISFMASITGFILLLFLSPVFSLVAGSVEKKLIGASNPFTIGQFLLDIWRAVKITIRNLFLQYITLAVLLLILSFFSDTILISLLGKALVYIVTSYFYGFILLDYAMEVKQMDYRSSVTYVRSHIGFAIGLGSIYFAIISVNNLPLINTYLGNIGLYWSLFTEAIVAFVGVIAAVILINQKS